MKHGQSRLLIVAAKLHRLQGRLTSAEHRPCSFTLLIDITRIFDARQQRLKWHPAASGYRGNLVGTADAGVATASPLVARRGTFLVERRVFCVLLSWSTSLIQLYR